MKTCCATSSTSNYAHIRPPCQSPGLMTSIRPSKATVSPRPLRHQRQYHQYPQRLLRHEKMTTERRSRLFVKPEKICGRAGSSVRFGSSISQNHASFTSAYTYQLRMNHRLFRMRFGPCREIESQERISDAMRWFNRSAISIRWGGWPISCRTKERQLCQLHSYRYITTPTSASFPVSSAPSLPGNRSARFEYAIEEIVRVVKELFLLESQSAYGLRLHPTLKKDWYLTCYVSYARSIQTYISSFHRFEVRHSPSASFGSRSRNAGAFNESTGLGWITRAARGNFRSCGARYHLSGQRTAAECSMFIAPGTNWVGGAPAPGLRSHRDPWRSGRSLSHCVGSG